MPLMRNGPSIAFVMVGVMAACAEPPSAPTLGTTTSEVIGGTAVPAGRWRDVAAVYFGSQAGCTGVLVAPNVALTAGHCNDTSLRKIVVGTNSLANEAAGETLAVQQRIAYPSWESSVDITVLKLATSSTIAPRPIATGWARLDIVNGAEVALVGFGAIDANASQFVDELQEARTAVTDAGCETQQGCNLLARPAGELGAGALGIDTCDGDSGGPLYLETPYGTFLAGITSRAYDDAQLPCGEGGIYGRPDKIVDWIEAQTGVTVARGPEPRAETIRVVRGTTGESTIAPNDPTGTTHTFAITTPPAHALAEVDGAGVVRVCANADTAVEDSLVVTITDAATPARSLPVTVALSIIDGTPGNCARVEPGPEDPTDGDDGSTDGDAGDADGGDDDDGGCAAGRGGAGGGTLIVLGAILHRRRRRP